MYGTLGWWFQDICLRSPCLEQNKQCVLCKFKLQMEHGHWVIDLLGDRRSHLSWLGLPCFVVFSLLSFK